MMETCHRDHYPTLFEEWQQERLFLLRLLKIRVLIPYLLFKLL